MLAPVEMIMETDVLQSYGEIQKLEMTVLSQDSSETVYYFLPTWGKEKMKAIHLPFEFIVSKKAQANNELWWNDYRSFSSTRRKGSY